MGPYAPATVGLHTFHLQTMTPLGYGESRRENDQPQRRKRAALVRAPPNPAPEYVPGGSALFISGMGHQGDIIGCINAKVPAKVIAMGALHAALHRNRHHSEPGSYKAPSPCGFSCVSMVQTIIVLRSLLAPTATNASVIASLRLEGSAPSQPLLTQLHGANAPWERPMFVDSGLPLSPSPTRGRLAIGGWLHGQDGLRGNDEINVPVIGACGSGPRSRAKVGRRLLRPIGVSKNGD